MKLPHISMVAFIDTLVIIKAIMLGLLLIMGIWFLGRLDHQTQQIKILSVQNNKLSRQLAASNEDIKTHIDCIIIFFGLPNRASLSIQNVCHFAPSSQLPTPSTPNTKAVTVLTAPQSPSKVFVSSSSPNPAPKADKTQADKPQPTPAPSLFQQILNATSDTFEMLNPFN